MTKGRDRVRMAAGESAAFVASQHKAIIATNGQDGYPHLVAMYYVLVNGNISLSTFAASQKVKNLKRDRKLSCLVESGDRYEKLRGVLLKGVAELSAEPKWIIEVTSAIAQHSRGSLTDTKYRQITKQVDKRVIVTLHHHSIVSWDHTKVESPLIPQSGSEPPRI